MISKISKKCLTLTLLVALMSMMFAIEVSADESKVPGALTTPPPQEEVSSLALNPSFKYLYDGQLTISALGNLKARLRATTVAYEIVNSLGADVSIQRWTGTEWVTVQTTTLSTTSSDSYVGMADWSVTAGYYYRGMGNHWIKKGSIKEEYVIHTSSLLITQ
ncbi:hypothetical protein ACP8HI_09475 [Paenibacillus sp. FA6]|uniref:hypothetical protein n=1 Tax=Paenibacillus sp. FA6 TaxID=3413029 RepID=UPI003F659E32